MITQIAYELVKTFVMSVAFSDKWAGLVVPMRKMDNKVEKIMPVAVRTKTNCDSSDFMDLVPDDSKASIIYAEKFGEVKLEPMSRDFWLANADLRIVVWYNLNRITEGDYVDEGVVAMNLISQMPKRLANSLFTYVSGVMITVTGITTGAEIFNKYTYDEVRTQFMTYPYGAFAIDVNVQYVLNKCASTLLPEYKCGEPEYVIPEPLVPMTFDSDKIKFDSTVKTFDSE